MRIFTFTVLLEDNDSAAIVTLRECLDTAREYLDEHGIGAVHKCTLSDIHG
jgi:hypothetical protein